jgi:DNA-binding MarR family transcriptional regulator
VRQVRSSRRSAARRHAGPDDPDLLRSLIQEFVRRFGLLDGRTTPCGQPLATSHAHALMVLLAGGGEHPSQRELGEALRVDKSTVARLCRRMERAGDLRRERCPRDGRTRRLRLTTRGRARARSLDHASRERHAALLEAVPPRARPLLLDGLRALNAAIDRLGPRGGS